MVDTISKEDVDWLTLIDWEAEVPCEIDGGCTEVAEWHHTTTCCGVSVLVCDFHHEQWVEFMRENAGQMRLTGCCMTMQDVGTYIRYVKL